MILITRFLLVATSALTAVFTSAPASAGGPDNPIDRYLQRASKKDRLAFLPADELTFLRRATLDLTGRLPTPDETRAFLEEDSLTKRFDLVDRLLASPAFLDRWTSFLGDLYANRVLVETGESRNAFHLKLREMVADNAGLDEIASHILTFDGFGAEEGSALPFWIVEAADNEFRLDFLDDQMALITSSMLGVQTECISCHDGANHLEQVNKGLSVMKREQFWSMAAMLSKTYFYIANQQNDAFINTLRLVDVDDPSFNTTPGGVFVFLNQDPPRGRQLPEGEYIAESNAGDGMRPPRKGGVISPGYLFTGEEPGPGERRREALARMIVSDRQFARNMVNRLWAHFFGEGFVEPVDGWDLGRIDPETAAQFGVEVQPRDRLLMETLTDRFIQSGYDLRALMRTIAKSSIYQADLDLAAAAPSPSLWATAARTRRLEAESIVDAIFDTLDVSRHYVVSGMTDQTFGSAWQLPDSYEPNPFALFNLDGDPNARARELGYRSVNEFVEAQAAARDLLDAFGRPRRLEAVPRNNEANVQNALIMMNDERIANPLFGAQRSAYVRGLQARLSVDLLTREQAIDELFQRTLFRRPTAQERALALEYWAQRPDSDAIPDMLWMLFNHPDFLYK